MARNWRIIQGDALTVLRTLPSESVNCCVTSPPYWGLRDYGHEGQMGLEKTPELYVAAMTEVFREVRRILQADGTLFLNVGDSYNGSGKGGQSEEKRSVNWQPIYANKGNVAAGMKPKDLVGIPWMVAFALRTDGWYLRQDIIWSKPNPMPESVRDRCTKAHEYIFLMSKSARYFYDAAAISELCLDPEDDARRIAGVNGDHKSLPDSEKNGLRKRNDKFVGKKYDGEKHSEQSTYTGSLTRNKRSVWEVTTKPYPEAHFATFPPEIPETCIKAGCPEGGVVLDPFAGAGTTGLVATRLHRNFIGIELNPKYVAMAERRIMQDAPLLNVQCGVGAREAERG